MRYFSGKGGGLEGWVGGAFPQLILSPGSAGGREGGVLPTYSPPGIELYICVCVPEM